MPNKKCGGFDFWRKKIDIFHFVRVRAKYNLSLVSRLSRIHVHVTHARTGIQLFGLKTTSHGKSDLKNT